MDYLKNSPEYLRDLTAYGAVEIDTFRLGKNIGFDHAKEFADILEEYQLKDTDKSFVGFPYMALWKGIRKNSDKEIGSISDLALEMNLLKGILTNLPSNSNNLKELCSALVHISSAFSNELHKNGHPYRR